jgi:hypothetical protein
VVDAMADVVLSRLRRYEDVLSRSWHDGEKEEFRNDMPRRRRLFEAMLPKLTKPDSDWRLPLHSHFIAFSQSDVDWLLDVLDATESITEQLVLAKIIRNRVWSPEPSLFSKLFNVFRRRFVLALEFHDLILGVQLESPAAEAARSNYEEYQRHQYSPEANKTIQPPPAERVARPRAD